MSNAAKVQVACMVPPEHKATIEAMASDSNQSVSAFLAELIAARVAGTRQPERPNRLRGELAALAVLFLSARYRVSRTDDAIEAVTGEDVDADGVIAARAPRKTFAQAAWQIVVADGYTLRSRSLGDDSLPMVPNPDPVQVEGPDDQQLIVLTRTLLMPGAQVPMRWFAEACPDMDAEQAACLGYFAGEQARLTSYSVLTTPLISAGSVSALTLATMRAGRPARAASPTRSISWPMRRCSVNGACRKARIGRVLVWLASCWNTASASPVRMRPILDWSSQRVAGSIASWPSMTDSSNFQIA